MVQFTQEQEEALDAVVRHYGFQYVERVLDDIVARIREEIMSVPLDKDPEKAALALYAKRMQAEGAQALRNSFINKVQAIKAR